MNSQAINPTDSFRLVSVKISNEHIWHGHVVYLAAAAGKKMRLLFRVSIEYYSHVCSAALQKLLHKRNDQFLLKRIFIHCSILFRELCIQITESGPKNRSLINNNCGT